MTIHRGRGAVLKFVWVNVGAKGQPKKFLVLHGKPVRARPTVMALLERLNDDFGRVVPIGQLAQAVRPNNLHTLRQHITDARKFLAMHKTNFVITVAEEIGYALCDIAMRRTQRDAQGSFRIGQEWTRKSHLRVGE